MRIRFVIPETKEERRLLRSMGCNPKHFGGPGVAIIEGDPEWRKLERYRDEQRHRDKQ